QRAENGKRPVAQRPALVMRHIEEIADHLDGNGGRAIADQDEIPFFVALWFGCTAEARPEAHQISFNLADRRRRERAHAGGRDGGAMMRRGTRVCAGGSLKTRLVVWCS